jgi:hypothetical protein
MTAETPRDFRDDIDIDEALDRMRTLPRAKARELYLICLQCAYHQGRAEVAGELAAQHRRMIADILKINVETILEIGGQT